METVMDFIIQSLLVIHIVCGFASLVLFWLPVAEKKGGNAHRKVGLWYVYTMSVVALSALVLSIENLLTDRITIGLFLGFLSLLTARPLWLGVECLNCKQGLTSRYKVIHFSTSIVLAISGFGLLMFGLSSSSSLATVMIVFGILGLTALTDVITMLRAKYSAQSKQWLKDHIANMFVGGIAAHTAFLVFGGQSMLPSFQNQLFSIFMWTAPSVIGLIAIKWAKHKYTSKPKSKKPIARTNSTAIS